MRIGCGQYSPKEEEQEIRVTSPLLCCVGHKGAGVISPLEGRYIQKADIYEGESVVLLVVEVVQSNENI